jgi:signal transduction histidine kinase
MTFLAEVARLAASTRTWDELMVTIVDRAQEAARADVCSLYLMDRDGAGITLAATNGLAKEYIGRAKLRLGQGITGIAAETRSPITSLDIRNDERFAWITGPDQPHTSMCSVPLIWNDQVVGVLNVQTVRPRRFLASDVRFLETLAALLAGVVEKGRLQQVDRLDQAVDSILESMRIFPSGSMETGPMDLTAVVEETVKELGPLFRRHRLATDFLERPLRAHGAVEPTRRLLGYLLENAAKYAPINGNIDLYGWRAEGRAYLAITDDGPGIPEEWRERIFDPFVRLDDSPRGAGIGLFAARRLAHSMGGQLRVEPRSPRGSQFVLELAAIGPNP